MKGTLKRKVALLIGTALLLIALPLLGACAREVAKEVPVTTLTVCSGFAMVETEHLFGYHDFLKRVESYSEGRIKIDYRGGPEVTPIRELVKSVKLGMYDLVYTVPVFHMGEVLATNVTQFGWEPKQGKMLTDPKVVELTDKIYRHYGIQWMGDIHPGLTFLTWTNKLPELRDGKVVSLKGLKVRSSGPGGSEQLKALGATSVALVPPEVYEALAKRILDGVVGHLGTVPMLKWEEHLKYAINYPMVTYTGTFVMNKEKFDKLPKDLQKVLLDARRDSHKEMYKFVHERHRKLLMDLKEKKGIQVLEASPEFARKVEAENLKLLRSMADAIPELSEEIYRTFEPYYKSS